MSVRLDFSSLQVIASCLYNKLCDQETLVELARLPIATQTHNQLGQFGDFCYKALTASTASKFNGFSCP